MEERNLLDEYADHVRSFVDLGVLVPLKVVADTANGMGGLVAPKVFDAAPLRRGDPLPRARRQLPQPPGRPDPAREPDRVEGRHRQRRGRRRPGLRRGCRPRVPGGRARRAGVGLADHRAGGRLHARQAPGRDRPLQLHLLPGRARGHRRARRDRHPYPGGPQLHQGGDGRDRGDLRWRALGSLLLRPRTTGPTRGSSPPWSSSSC